ncbi:hypothetical protein HOLleu_14298 [Holothuria leucospilota]|uniref:Uncharacterized protein n=1 Tax=Holothuria leucospilota TaxID=206669 RepID=A0A9Q1C8P6_HOLLE|nr:hypothetical protein HOLleu_14298 [Holothuria leucospilota]
MTTLKQDCVEGFPDQLINYRNKERSRKSTIPDSLVDMYSLLQGSKICVQSDNSDALDAFFRRKLQSAKWTNARLMSVTTLEVIVKKLVTVQYIICKTALTFTFENGIDEVRFTRRQREKS